MNALTSLIVCTMLGSALPAAESATRVLPAGQLPHDQRLGPLKDLNDYFPFTPCPTREAWARRAAELLRQVLVAAGLWPMPVVKSGSPTVFGKVDRDGYTVEKVILETYPGCYLTGSLYRPKGRTGRLPAVLSPHGHWPEGRFYDAGEKELRRQIVEGAERFDPSGRYPLQARCVQLARMGCVVFHYDMVSAADSHQLAHRAGARAEMNDPKRWGFFSPQAEARLQTIFGLQTYNSVRALDFLSALADVDPRRIGVTGASGGGTQTLILCAIDPRPAVSFPAVMVSTAMQGGCPCENACYLRLGSGNIELAALFTPKPLGMTAADDWTKEIATKGLPELKQHYRLFGAEDLVMAKPLVHFPHNYNYVSRAVMYHWFNKHLKLGLDEPIVEEDFRPLSVAEMSVWDAAHPAPPTGDEFERAFVARMTKDTQQQIETLRPHDRASLEEYRRIVGGAVATMIGRGLPEAGALHAANSQSIRIGPWQVTKFLLRYPAAGEELPVIRLMPKAWNHRVVIWIDRQGKQGLFAPGGAPRAAVQTLLAHGFSVVGADLFGQGEFTADGRPLSKARMNRSKHAAAGESWGDYAGFTFGYNPSLFAQRVRDILSLVAFLHQEPDAARQVDVIGLGGAGHWVAAACALAGSAIDRAAIDTAGFRFANLATIDDPDFLPGGAKYGDLPGIIALSAPHALWLAGENQATAATISAAYRAAKFDDLTIHQGKSETSESAAVAWLLKQGP